MKETTKKRQVSLTAVLLFIAGTALSLQTTAPFFGWGAGPEYGYASILLKRASFFGYPVQEIIGKISSYIPTNSIEFSASLLFAVLFGLTLVFIFSTTICICKSPAAGIAGALVFASLPATSAYFRSCTPESWSIFLAAAVCAAAAYNFDKPSNARLLTVAFITGLGAFQNETVFLIGFAAIAASAFIKKNRVRPTAFVFALLFLFLFSVQSVFLFFRPPMFISWSEPIPPWTGVTIPMRGIKEILLSSVNLLEIPYKLYETAQCISGAFLPMTAIAVIGIIFYRKSANYAAKALWNAIIPVLVISLVLNHALKNVNTAILMMLVFTAGGVGIALIAENSFRGKTSAFIIGGIICLALTLPPVLINFTPIINSQTKNNPEFISSFFKSMKRDALLVIDSKDDPLYGIYYFQDCRGTRRDITILDVQNLFQKEYRSAKRKEHRNVLIPSEKKYNKLLEQITGMMPNNKKEINAYLKNRIQEGLIGSFEEYIIMSNYPRSNIYFNRIDAIMNSKLYVLMQFMPENFLFRLNPSYIEKLFKLQNNEDDKRKFQLVYLNMDDLAGLGKKSESFDPETKKAAAIFFENIGENFHLQEMYDQSALMMERCMSLDPSNISCRFFLGRIYRYKGMYDTSERQYITAANLIKKKQLSGKHDSSDLFMLDYIYSELNQTDKAQQYRKLVKPEGDILPPGYSRPQ